MDLRTFLSVVLRSWWLIALSVLTTAGSAAWVVRQQEPVYRAATRIEIKPSAALEEGQYINVQRGLENRTIINTEARKATGTAMREQVAERLGVKPEDVAAADIAANVLPETNLIEIRAMSTNPRLAAALSNTVAAELSSQAPARVIEIEVIDSAAIPTVPVEPQPVRTITLGVLFGLALGVLFALGYFMLQTLRSPSPARGYDSTDDLAEQDDMDLQKTQQFFVP
jgi:capsular polysaccharide biosynthesis protein